MSWREMKNVTGVVTTNSYADAASVETLEPYASFAVVVKETGGANGITFKVQVSIDGTNYVDHPTAAFVDVAVGAGLTKTVQEALCGYNFYKVQVKATVGGSQGTVTASLLAK